MNNMLQALIRTSEDTPGKRRGDVICIKIKEYADWGSEELKFHQPVDWEDQDLEKKMKEHLKCNFGGFPIVALPYKKTKPVDVFSIIPYKNSGHKKISEIEVCTTRSSKFFDFEKLGDFKLKERIISNDQEVKAEEIEQHVASACIREKTEKEIEEEFQENKSLVETYVLQED